MGETADEDSYEDEDGDELSLDDDELILDDELMLDDSADDDLDGEIKDDDMFDIDSLMPDED